MNVDGPRSVIVFREIEGKSVDDSAERSAEDPTYHQMREEAERQAAAQAQSPLSRQIHQELAEAHSKLARAPGWPRGH